MGISSSFRLPTGGRAGVAIFAIVALNVCLLGCEVTPNNLDKLLSKAPPTASISLTSAALTSNPVATFTVASCAGISSVMINESISAPSASAAGWQSCSTSASALSFTLSGDGAHGTLHAWSKSSAGVVSASPSSPDLSVTLDTTPPTLVLTSLTGGQAILGGAATTITWTVSFDQNPAALPILVQYSSDGGTSWTTIAGPIADSGSQAWTPPSVSSSTFKVRVVATDALGNQGAYPSSSNFIVDITAPPTPTLMHVNGSTTPPTTPHNNSVVDLQAGPDALVNITHFCLKSNNSVQPLATDSCWVAVNAPIPNQPVAASFAMTNFPYRFGFAPNTTYNIYAWVKNSVGLVSTNTATIGGDKVAIYYQPFPPPTIINVTATSDDNPCAANTSSDVAVAAGNPVFVKWNASTTAGFGATPISLFYTTDDQTWTAVPGGGALSNGVNGACHLASNPVTNGACTPTTAVDVNAKTGCFLWASAPSSSYFKVRVVATDINNSSSVTSAIPPMNVFPPINFLAGNPDLGLGGSASAVPLLNRQTSANGGLPDPGSFVITSRGGIYTRDWDNGVLWMDPSTGNMSQLIKITGASTGDGGAATSSTLTVPLRLDIDFQDRLYIWDNNRVRRVEVDVNGAPTTISTVLGGGGSSADGVAPTSVQLYNSVNGVSAYAGEDLKLTILPNGDMYFAGSQGGIPNSGYKLRKYTAATGLVTSVSPHGTGYFGNASADMATCTHWAGLNPIFDPTSSVVSMYASEVWDQSAGNPCYYVTYGRGLNLYDLTGAKVSPTMSMGAVSFGTNALHLTGLDGKLYASANGYFGRYDPTSNTWTTLLGNGSSTTNCTDGTAALACALNIQDYFVDQQSNIYWLAYGVIRTLDQSGKVVTIAGQSMSAGDGGSALSARIPAINSGRTWRNAGTDKVVIVDPVSSTVREASVGGTIAAIVGNGTSANAVPGSATGQGFLIYGPYTGSDVGLDPSNGYLYTMQGAAILQLNRGTGNWVNFVGGGPMANYYYISDGFVGTNINPSAYGINFAGVVGGNLYVGLEGLFSSGCAGYCYETMKSYNVATTVQSAYLAEQLNPPGSFCTAGTAVSACNPTSTFSAYDSVGDGVTGPRWIMTTGTTNGTDQTLMSVPLNTAGTVTQLVVLPRGFDSFTYNDPSDGGNHRWVYYCSSGRLYKYNVGSAGGGETALTWPIAAMSCVGSMANPTALQNNALWYDTNRQTVVFPYKENGLYGVAEYINP